MTPADTGFLIALLDRRDALHERALAWSVAAPRPWLVHEYVLLETLNALADTPLRPSAHRVAMSVTETTGPFQYLPVDPLLLGAGLELYARRPDKAWSLTDCISFHIMDERGLTRALAHDHHFQQAGFEPLLRREP